MCHFLCCSRIGNRKNISTLKVTEFPSRSSFHAYTVKYGILKFPHLSFGVTSDFVQTNLYIYVYTRWERLLEVMHCMDTILLEYASCMSDWQCQCTLLLLAEDDALTCVYYFTFFFYNKGFLRKASLIIFIIQMIWEKNQPSRMLYTCY